jgi:hypothetical protein
LLQLEQLKQALLSNQLRTTWILIGEISGKRRYNSASKIRRPEGIKINSTVKPIEEWKIYFEGLLNVKSNSQNNS